MNLSQGTVGHAFVALAVLLLAAHAGGTLFARLRQPRVIGEIVGGLALGPTGLGLAWPGFQRSLLPADGPVHDALGVLYQLGLVLLMFTAAGEFRRSRRADERRTALTITATGTAIPFALGLAAAAVVPLDSLLGTAQDHTALTLVFASAVAVTSIPVISRIMLDLGIIRTSFARIVIGAAVLEDVLLYAVLAVAVGLVTGPANAYGLAHELRIAPASVAGAAYYAAATGAVLAVATVRQPPRVAALLTAARASVAAQMVVLLGTVAVGLLLGITPMVGGLAAGLLLRGDGAAEERTAATEAVSRTALGVFVPLYFALVGFQLDLVHDLDPVALLAFLLFACVAKFAAVYLGARLAREPQRTAYALAVAMNARGGPGIVLATVAFSANIIDDGFFTTLVLVAILTSLAAGWWLGRVVRTGAAAHEELRRLRPEPGPGVPAAAPARPAAEPAQPVAAG